MTSSQPPKLAVALLDRFVGDPALIGDLIEEFRERRSRVWFWQQTLHAMLIDSFRGMRDDRPLRLGTSASVFPLTSVRAVSCDRRIPGIDSLQLIGAGVLMTAMLPDLWWFVLYGVSSGAVLGVAMVIIRRRRLV